MKKVKNMLIYVVILVLCIAAFIGFFTGNNQEGKETAVTDSSGGNVTDTVEGNRAEGLKEKADQAENEQGLGQYDSIEKKMHAEEIMKKSAAEPATDPVVGIGQGTDFGSVAITALENAGGLQDLISEGDVVVIKPNICTTGEAGGPLITDYRIVQAIADEIAKNGASKIIVAEGTINGNAFSPLYLKLNMYENITGVELFNLNGCSQEECYELEPENSVTGKALFIPQIYMDADVVINIAKLKTHFQPDAVVSLGLKNSIGVPSEKVYGGMGYKGGLHNLGLKEAIVDLNKIRKPDLTIIDGIVGGEGYGPLRNTPVESNIVFAGRDIVAVDTVAASFMGYEADAVPHLVLAGEQKLGINDISCININGADLDEIRMSFKRY